MRQRGAHLQPLNVSGPERPVGTLRTVSKRGHAGSAGIRVAAVAAGANRKRRADGEATRRLVLDAAVECILELGYYKTSTNEIARRAGVTWGTLQYQFGNRESLLIAVLNDRWDTLQRTLREATVNGESLEERLAEVVDVLATYYGVPSHLAQIQILLDLTHNSDTSEEVRRAVSAHGRELVRAWRPLFERALGDAARDRDLVTFAFTSLRGYLTGRVIASRIADTTDDRFTRTLLVRGVACAIRDEAAARGIRVD